MTQAETDHFYRQFGPAELLAVIQDARERVPGCKFARSGNNTGNLCVFDADSEYVGVISLGAHPTLTLFDED